MKAALALIVIYIGMFFVAIQGGPPSSVQAAAQSSGEKQNGAKSAAAIDPVKDSDIRALLELVGARDQVQDSVRQTAEQYREKLLATVPDNEKGQAFVNTTINEYEKRYDVDRVTEQLVGSYDKHYSDEEIKSLLQFYGSPLGQKVAAESPKIFREIQETTRTRSRQGRTRRAAASEAGKSGRGPKRAPEQWQSAAAARATRRRSRRMPASRPPSNKISRNPNHNILCKLREALFEFDVDAERAVLVA